MSVIDDIKEINYSPTFELVLKNMAEQFSCLAKAHDMASRWAESWSSYFTIPTIILSGLSGIGAVGSSNLLPFEGNTILIGMLSFLCATLQTIASHYSFSARATNHRNTCVQYSKLHQLIVIELSLPRNERIEANKLIKIIKEDAVRLLETAPILPKIAILQFQKEFANTPVSVPFILNGLEPVKLIPQEIKIDSPRPDTPKIDKLKIRVEV